MYFEDFTLLLKMCIRSGEGDPQTEKALHGCAVPFVQYLRETLIK